MKLNYIKIYIQILIVLLCISCQNEKNKTFSLSEDVYEQFQVVCDKDTVLRSKTGVVLTIKANTFDCSEQEKIDLRFATIMSKSDMILNKLYSVDENGAFLETGGMFQLKDITNNTESFSYPVQLNIPATAVNSNMSTYSSVEIENRLVWSKTTQNIATAGDENVKQGQSLYKHNCMGCHSVNLRKKSTGPALGNVHLFRDKEWLLEFTRNSSRMIRQGDSIALCVFQNSNRMAMTSFPSLSTKDIKDIYEYIANESKVQGIEKNEIDYITACEIDTTMMRSLLRFDNTKYSYVLKLNSNRLVNVDYLLPFESMIAPITITLDKEYENIAIALTFKERNIVIPFVQMEMNTRKFSLYLSEGKEKINFPLGEKVHIIAYSEEESFKYTILEYEPKKEGNTLQLRLEQEGKEKFLKQINNL